MIPGIINWIIYKRHNRYITPLPTRHPRPSRSNVLNQDEEHLISKMHTD
ncbi:15205_t:CDS:1 [Dentiscutata erythropus]|uniref:15205_t:CDS:1 n=1 Tax=Dentiscutata erythropus TaxID=1348616 RepID=A0A9N9D718_9GLOM|nr:15205_t:CDS:1 [Dentiscutata erythropus]